MLRVPRAVEAVETGTSEESRWSDEITSGKREPDSGIDSAFLAESRVVR